MASKILFLIGFLFLLFFFVSLSESSSSSSSSSSSNCLALYKEGGAAAVVQSPQCFASVPGGGLRRRRYAQSNCQLATLQGRRRYQEDRPLCALGIKVPFLGRKGFKEMDVGMAAVFDGHNGAEASDMASKLLIDYFLLHTFYLLNERYSMGVRRPSEMLASSEQHNLDKEYIFSDLDAKRLARVFGRRFQLEILKESLLRTIRDIDAAFLKEASRKNLKSGSTANVVLIADGHILASNVGDSKSLLCSESPHPPELKGHDVKLRRRIRRRNGIMSSLKLSESGPGYYVKELTRDHRPDRDEERKRVEAAGGYVMEWAGVPRVNGQLAISRAIGDLYFKNYGVISAPEVTDWQLLTTNDSYLVAASDGIFEKMTTQEVCDTLWDEKLKVHMESESRRTVTHSLADCIVQAAFESGSMDNLSAVVIPLGFTSQFENFIEEMADLEGTSVSSYFGIENVYDTTFR